MQTITCPIAITATSIQTVPRISRFFQWPQRPIIVKTYVQWWQGMVWQTVFVSGEDQLMPPYDLYVGSCYI